MPARPVAGVPIVAALVSVAACTPGERWEAPWTGERRMALLLLSWTDEPETAPPSSFEAAWLDPHGPSFAAYIDENSLGACAISGEVLGWRRADARWADQDASDPSSIAAVAIRTFRRELDEGAFDADGNGRVDHLVVVHSGRTPFDRPHPSEVFGTSEADETAVVQSLGVGSVGEQPPIGLYAHEAGHRWFRLRDAYGDYEHGDYGIGIWGVMGLGQWGPRADIPLADLFRHPVHFRAASKARIGWIEPTVVERTARDLRLDPIETSGQSIAVPFEDQDIVLEVRGPHGFSEALPGHGLLIWREFLDPGAEASRGVLVQADGRDDLANGTDLGARPLPPTDENFGDASDPFPGSLGVTAWEDPALGIRVENVRAEGDSVRFDIVLAP